MVCLRASTSALLTVNNAVDFACTDSTPKWVQYKKQRRKVEARGFTVVHSSVVHLAGACISQGLTSHRGMHLTNVHLTGVHLIGIHLIEAYISGACISGACIS